MKQRGQSGLEYMVTYGWAILVLLGVAFVMWQTGVFSITKNIEPGKTGFAQVKPIDWSASASGFARLTVINNAGTRLNVTGVSSSSCAGGQVGGLLLPGDTQTLNLTGCSFTGNAGDYYRLTVTIAYDNPKSHLNHSSVGDVWGPLD